ncbi:MAG TPA: amino acid adenylation domain-containing protein, partial [Thermoanaerobaculia bacterium]
TELAWWRARLAGMPPALELPADRPRPARQSFRGGSRGSCLDPRTGAGLVTLGRRHGATPFMTTLAAFYTLLHRYTGEEDLAVGTLAAGRGSAETQGLIGFFVNTLVLRASLAGDPSFLELLARARTTVLEAYAHQDLPFEQLVAALAPQRDLARAPLFQVLLTFRERSPGLQLGPGLTAAMAELPAATTQLDLSLQVSQDGDELGFTAEYATDLFDAATIDRLLGHLGTLLAGIAAAPETRLSLLPLLTPAEREQLAAWSSTGEPRPAGATLHGLFAAQAARTPEAVAVIAREGTLTYRELDARAERLARRLAALGAGIDSRVGLFLERSPEMVVALLGVLKAGAAYVPLDPDYPAERLAAMLADARPVAVLAQERLADRLPAGTPSLFLEEGWDPEAGGGLPTMSAIPAAVPEEAAAYLIFTSGSTGRPKAATVPHRAIVNHMLWMQAEFPLGPADRVLQKTAFSFDASVWEFWAPLLAGATLVMAAPGEQREPAALIRGLREHGVTVLQAVPSLLRALLEEGGLGECRSLRRVFCGGEALGADVQTDFFAVQEAELVNLYGPTETTVEVTFWRCERARAARPALLGGPIPNARLHVLGARLEPCPVGVPGELFVGGVPVSRGYLGRAAETAASFLPDPFAAAPGERLYRTGDRVRRRPDGLLEYLGRADGQVKVRGFRVELGEVEAALLRAGARQAAVIVRSDRSDRSDGSVGSQLVAYFAGDATAGELRQALRERLPDYMVPALFVELPALPLTPNGKVDRRALRALPSLPGAGHEPVAPRTHREERVAGLWRDVLQVDRLGIHDNFWELGGHSLLATRLAHRVRESFGVELPVRTLFERPTLAGYTEAIAAALQGLGERAEPIAPRMDSGPAPLSHAQQRLWFLDRLQPGQAVYNLPVLFAVAGPLAADALAAALAETVRRHDVLRTTFQVEEESGDPVQWVAAPAPWPLPRVDLAGLPAARRAAEADRLLAAERRLPFDLARGPLLRALLVRLGPHDHRLALTMHHIVSDGWSIGVLRRELQALYGAAAAGRPSPLPEPAVQYADFAVWQRRWLAGGEQEAQLAWWRQTLAGDPPALDLPTDRPRPPVRSLRGGLETLPLGPALSAAVEQL